MNLRRGLVLLLAAASPLAAQGARDRLAGRVPPTALEVLDSIVQDAARDGLPTEPLIQKALEGGAKGVAPDRIVAAVGASADQLRSARALLSSAGETRPSDPGEVTAVAAALSRGVSPQLVGRLSAALPGEPTGPALHGVADLVGHGFAEDSSVDLMVEGARLGLRDCAFWTSPRRPSKSCSAGAVTPTRWPRSVRSSPTCPRRRDPRRPRSPTPAASRRATNVPEALRV